MAIERKRVHFASTPVTRAISPVSFNEDIPRTPSPSWSDSSIPESSPDTPPSGSGSRKGLPIVEGIRVAPHPLVEFNHYTRHTPLNWNVTQALSSITIREGRHDTKGKGKAPTLVPADLAQSVTDPALEEMEIEIAGLLFWKPLQLSKAKSKGSPRSNKSPTGRPIARGALTLGEFLEGVHMYLMMPVSGKEYQAFPLPVQHAISLAFNTRCLAAGKNADIVRSQGLKRVDFLGECTQFATLMQSEKEPRKWTVYLQPAIPRPSSRS